MFIISAHCCYSCRAFFRRTVERIEKKGLKRCKTGRKNCDVTTSSKSCIHCRYNKCIQIGMTPELLQGKRKRDGPDDEEAAAEVDSEEDDERVESDQHQKNTTFSLNTPSLTGKL